jgi:hypothetical protein
MKTETLLEQLKRELSKINPKILDSHPILKYRLENLKQGNGVRGKKPTDATRCGLMLDDSIVAGTWHYPCVIYLREKGNPVGKVGPNMRQERAKWVKEHDCYADPICRTQCLDVCVSYNNKFRELNPLGDNNAFHPIT